MVCRNANNVGVFIFRGELPEVINMSIILVTGHTPTFLIREDGLPLIYEENGHIALDCGCV